MPEDGSEIREINYRRLFPWVELFRAFRIALDLRKLALGGLGAIVMYAAWWGVALAFSAGSEAEDLETGPGLYVETRWPWSRPLLARVPAGVDDFDGQASGATWQGVSELVQRPFWTLTRPFQRLFRTGDGWSFTGFAYSLLCGLLAVLIWGFFGGVITRLAAVQVARDEKIGLREALRFACAKYLSFVGGPLFPFAGILIFLVLCLAGGLVARIPWLGELFAGILWILPLMAGFVMAIILVGVAVGWPLMFATVSAEGSDSFDALSRSYSYVYQRPWQYGFYWLVALIYGTIVTAFVLLFATLIVYLAGWAVSWGAGVANVAVLYAYAPQGWNHLFGEVPEVRDLNQVFGARLVGFWLYVIFVLLIGFAYSYFWTASTVIYFLLRSSVDATDLDEVYLEEEEQEEFGMAPEMELESESPLAESSGAPAAGPPASGAPDVPRTEAAGPGTNENEEEPSEGASEDPDTQKDSQ